MTSRERMIDLLERWQVDQDRGREATSAELCRDHPDLLPELERCVADLRRLNRLAAEIGETLEQTGDPAGPDAATQSEPGRIAPDARRPSGTIFGYEVLSELGRGGMGVVYKARDAGLKRHVALKMMRYGADASPEERARFRAEAEAVARLQHPHIVQVFQAGEHEGQPFFVMEYVAGGSLETVAAAGPHAPADVARLALLLARAVHAAHQAGVVHRDLKPGNVLLAPAADEPALNTRWGCPKVSDFGLARLQEGGEGQTASGVAMGTPSYMAPEQAEGRLKEIGPATDVWALGVMIYRLLTGRLPFRADSTPATLLQVCNREPEPLRQLCPEVPEALEAVVMRCLRKQAGERYPTAAALADDLKFRLDGTATPTTPAVAPLPRRRAWPLAAACVAVLMIVLAGGGWLLSGLFTSVPPTPSEPGIVAPVEQPAFKGWIDILVSEPGRDKRQLLRLHEPGARPLQTGDEVRVEVVLTGRPGYAYVLWIDARGKVIPVYPWQDIDDWNSRPKQEKLVSGKLLLPEDGTIYPIEPSPEGLETLLLLVRETPLPAGVDLPGLLGDLGPQTGTDQDYVRWFENGQVVANEPDHRAAGRAKESIDPAERTQGRIRQRLGERFAFSRAVSFFNLGPWSGQTGRALIATQAVAAGATPDFSGAMAQVVCVKQLQDVTAGGGSRR